MMFRDLLRFRTSIIHPSLAKFAPSRQLSLRWAGEGLSLFPVRRVQSGLRLIPQGSSPFRGPGSPPPGGRPSQSPAHLQIPKRHVSSLTTTSLPKLSFRQSSRTNVVATLHHLPRQSQIPQSTCPTRFRSFSKSPPSSRRTVSNSCAGAPSVSNLLC
jgi:hypothetical protein